MTELDKTPPAKKPTKPRKPRQPKPEPVIHCQSWMGGKMIGDTATGFYDHEAWEKIFENMKRTGFFIVTLPEETTIEDAKE